MSTFPPERLSGRVINLSPRVTSSKTVVASPVDATETIIATVTVPLNLQTFQAVELIGWAALTVGTNGVSAQLKLRQTNAAGATIADSGACTTVATNLIERQVFGSDAAPAAGQVYVLTLTVASGSAASTVSAVYLRALIV